MPQDEINWVEAVKEADRIEELLDEFASRFDMMKAPTVAPHLREMFVQVDCLRDQLRKLTK